MERIVKNGRDGFYKGKTADLIVEEMKNVGGWITHKDLENYKSLYRDPIEGSFKNYDILSMGPPSSGGILLIHMLNMFDEIMKKSESLSIDLSYNSIDYIHILTEIERRAYADRAEHLADADFWDVPEGMLLSKDYAKERVSSIDLSSERQYTAVNT